MAQQFPFGDAFLVQTPSLDRLSQQLYAEQRQRQAMHQRNAQIADQELQKELGKVRSADIPEILSDYENYKAASKKALFDKSIQNDTLKRNAALLEAQKAKANYLTKTAQSQELLNQGKQLAAEHMRNPNLFVDDFGDKYTQFNNTPLSKLGELANPETYRYKGTNTDFGKMLAAAAGQPKSVYNEEVPADNKGIQTKITPYSFGNNPLQYRDQLIGNLSQRQAGRDAAIMWHQTPTQEKDAVDQAYAATSPEKLKKMGLTSLPDLPINTGNDAVDWANFQAKKYLVANEPKAGTTQYRTNEAKKFAMETDRMMRMKAIEHANAKDLIQYKKSIDPSDKQMNDLWVDKYIQTLKDAANATGAPMAAYKKANGATIYESDIPLDPTLASSLQKSGITPTFLRVTSDGKFRPVYLKTDKEGNPIGNKGNYAVDETLSVPITEEQLGVALGKKNVTGKPRAKEINNILNKGAKAVKPKNDPLGLF